MLASDPALGDGLQQGFKIAEETRCPMSEEVLFAAQKTLETIELDSKTTPVIRGYIEAAADVGSILLDLSQVRLSELNFLHLSLNVIVRQWTGTNAWRKS